MLVEQDSELESDSEQFVQKGFDFVVIDTLIKDFSFKPAQMTEWFGLSRQSIYNALEKRNRKRTDCWTGKPLNADEEKILHLLIDKRKFEYNDDTLTCCCMNNMQDKCMKGNHQTPDSDSGPWESHPCRVLRQLRREVSLSL